MRILKDERYAGTYIIGKHQVTEVGSHRVRLKDESEWIKIPDHHPAIVSKELFEQVNSQLLHFKSVKKLAREYPLRGTIFCGCCRHAMPGAPAKNHQFICRYTTVDENASCHGMKIAENELETMLFQVLAKQARIILNLDNPPMPERWIYSLQNRLSMPDG